MSFITFSIHRNSKATHRLFFSFAFNCSSFKGIKYNIAMVKFQINNDCVVLVDDEDACLLDTYKWNINKWKGKRYLRTTVYKPQKHDLYLHHLIIGGRKEGHVLYYLDGNTLNLQKENIVELPSYTKSHVNNYLFLNKTSKYRGVYFLSGKFIAQISFNGETRNLGKYQEEREAAIIYDLKAIELYREYANTNIVNNPFKLLKSK